MARLRRRQRASLRGWWRALPFVAMIGVTLFVFTWLHTQRLQNEYRANELSREIRLVDERIGDLRGERYDLGRLQRMDAEAPEHALVEARPGQIRIVKVTREELAALEGERVPVPERTRVTRSAVIHLRDVTPVRAPVAPDTTVAQKTSGAAGGTTNQF
jgi:hypothetical protein